MIGISERLAIVETHIEQIHEDGDRREEAQKAMLEALGEMKDTLSEIQTTISKYQGFLGGAVFVVSSVGIFLSKFGMSIYQLFKAKTGV